MKIGLVTDSLGHLTLETMLETAAAVGVEMLEFGCGNWSSAPHLDLDRLLDSAAARQQFMARLESYGMTISALNCSGNPLHPGASGALHREVTSKTIRLARELGIHRVVMMSGCPGGPGDANANWITTAWPPETAAVLRWQWDEVLMPYWRGLVKEAGEIRLCLELHGQQNVYNTATMLRLRAAVGPTVGTNLDPSHRFWMGADPLAAIGALGEAIFHVHAKDTLLHTENAAINSLIDTTPMADLVQRSWSYVTLGHGHDALWWEAFCAELRIAGYDDVLSIEHEDVGQSPEEGVHESVEVLRAVLA
jgi:sugar phosphate isomerase/epimerase